MVQTRKRFMACGAASVAMGAALAFDGRRPLLRIGAMSDNHLHPDRKETHEKTSACFRLFRKMEVDVVVDTGDIADLSHVSELEYFRARFDECFAGTPTVPFFCVANHDYNYLPNTKRNDPKVIDAAVRALGMDSRNPCACVKGYRFASYFQHERIETLERNVKEAVAASEAGRPVFVVTHVPPFGTTTGTSHWSSRQIRRALDGFPQVVNLTGHIHTAITWPANIWQGEFTSINLGAHAQYSNPIGGEAMVLDVFEDRIDVRRYEAVSGREIGADDRWSVPLPLDPRNGPYRFARRMEAMPPPAFQSDAGGAYSQSRDGVSGTLSFPAAEPSGRVRGHRVEIESQGADGSWRSLAVLGQSVKQVMDFPKRCSFPVIPAVLDPGLRHRATVYPEDSFGAVGRPISFQFDVPGNPMEELPSDVVRVDRVVAGASSDGRTIAPGADGWLQVSGDSSIMLSAALSRALVGRRNPVLVMDLATEQRHTPRTLSVWRIPHGKGRGKAGVAGRIYTLAGRRDAQRYAWSLKLGKDFSEDDVLLVSSREGDDARYRINSVRCFVSAK